MVDRAALLLALFLPGAALAQEGGYDPLVLTACLDTRFHAARPQDCVGLAAARCIAGPDGSSNAGIGYCLLEEHAQWQGLRQDAIATLTPVQTALDADAPAHLPRAADAFVAANAAFDAYVQALCDWEETQWLGGSGRGPGVAQCLLETTAAEALRLRERIGQ